MKGWPRMGYVEGPAPAPDRRLVNLTGIRDGGALVRRLIRSGARWLVPTSLGSAVISGMAVVVPLAIGTAIDTGLVHGDLRDCLLWCLVILATYGVRAFATWLRLAGDVGGNRVEHDLRLTVLTRLTDHRGLGGPPRLPGDLLSVATTDLRAAVRGMTTVTSIPGHVVTLAGSFIALLLLDAALALVMVVATPLMVSVSVYGVRPLRPSTRAERRAEAEAAGSAADLTTGLRVVQGLGAVDQARRRFSVAGDRALAATISARRVRGVYTSAVTVVVGLFIAGLTIVGAYLGLSGRLTIGEVVAVAGLAQTMAPPLRSLGVDTAAVFSTSQASADRVLEVLDAPTTRAGGECAPPTTCTGGGSIPIRPAPTAVPGRVQLQGLQVDGAIYVPLDLQFPGHGILGILAPAATARAFVDVLARRRRPTAGWVRLAGPTGRDAAEVSPQEYRAQVLAPPQHPDLFDDTLLDNITLPRPGSPPADPSWLATVLTATTCDEVAATQPHGLATRIGEGGSALSGGQRQRVALARAVYAAPALLVLHEPTTSVDPATNARIAAGLRALRASAGTVLVTACPQLLACCDEVVVLDERGRIAARGSHADLLADQAYQQALS